jgi:hypothetical protein
LGLCLDSYLAANGLSPMSQREPYLHLVFIKLPLSKAVKAYKNKVNRWIIKLGKIIESYGVSMQNWFKTLVLLSAIIFSASCTKPDSHNDQSATGSADRGIASVKSKRGQAKKVKIEGKGLYIKHSSLKPLSFKQKVAYYQIFGKAMVLHEKQTKGARKGAHNLNRDNYFLNLIMPFADARLCQNGMWVLNFSDCQRSNTHFDPTTLEDWSRFGPVGISHSHCPSGSIPCPPFGIDMSGGTARLLCTPNRGSTTNACMQQYTSGGFENLVRLLDRCDVAGPNAQEGGVNCADLNRSVQNAINMHNENCRNPQDLFFPALCRSMERAVQQARRSIGENQDPGRVANLPDVESCNQLSGGVRAGNNRIGNPSPQWETLLRIAGRNCDNHPNDLDQLINRFGQCSSNIGGAEPNQSRLNALARDFTQAINTRDPGYRTTFYEEFGMNPQHMRDLFCNSNSAGGVIQNLNRNLGTIQEIAAERMVRDSVFTDPAVQAHTNLNRQQFDSIQQWYINNHSRMAQLRRENNYTDDIIANFQRQDPTRFANWLNQQLPNADPRRMEAEYNRSEMPGMAPALEYSVRKAMGEHMMSRLLPSSYADRTNQTAEWLRGCSQEILTAQGEERVTEDNRFERDGQVNTANCEYRQTSDFSGFWDENENRPYIIYDRNRRACLRVDNVINEPAVVNGRRELITRVRVADPTSQTDSGRYIVLSEESFDDGSNNSSARPYSLFHYTCQPEVASYQDGIWNPSSTATEY